MYLFLCSLFPLAILGRFFCGKIMCSLKVSNAYFLLVFWGLVAGSITCFVDFFFVYTSDASSVNLIRESGIYLLWKELFPGLICILIVLFFRDKAEYKVQYLFPLLAGFYAVYLPYYVFSSVLFQTGFGLFLLPVIMLLFTVGIEICCRVLVYDVATVCRTKKALSKQFIVCVVVCLLFLCWLFILPAYIWAVYLVSMYTSLWGVWSILYCIITIGCCCLFIRCDTKQHCGNQAARCDCCAQ